MAEGETGSGRPMKNVSYYTSDDGTKCLTDMSREELIEAVEHLGEQLRQSYEARACYGKMLGALAAQRGIAGINQFK